MKVLLTFVLTSVAMLLVGCGNDVMDKRQLELAATSQDANQGTAIATTTRPSSTVSLPAPDYTRPAEVATLNVPAAGNESDPTEGDSVPGLRNKTSFFLANSNMCIFQQSNRSDASNMANGCNKNGPQPQVQNGNICRNMNITAKCNIEIRGERFTIYNIGGLSREKENMIAQECAGLRVGNQVFKGTFVTLTDTYDQSIQGLPPEFRNILNNLFQRIFQFLLEMFNIPNPGQGQGQGQGQRR